MSFRQENDNSLYETTIFSEEEEASSENQEKIQYYSHCKLSKLVEHLIV